MAKSIARRRPVHHWIAVRSRARGMGAPISVLLLLNHLVERQGLNQHWKLPRIQIGYGRHSERERAWDRQRRAQVAREVGVRRLIKLPQEERPGLAERIGGSRRTWLRAGRWLVAHQLVHVLHPEGEHAVSGRSRRRDGTYTHWSTRMGRGGCAAGGVPNASVWIPDIPGVHPESPPGDASTPEPPPAGSGREAYLAARERLQGSHPRRGP